MKKHMKIIYIITFCTKTNKILIDSKPLRIRFDKIDGFIRVGSRNLVLFGRGKHDSIYNRIRYIISAKSDITYITFHSYAKIKVNLYNSLPLEKSNFS